MPEEIPTDVIKAMSETYDLEIGFTGLNKDAAALALQAGLAKYEARFVASIAREAEMYAGECEEGEDSEFGVALRWFASKLRERTPDTHRGTWRPLDGDVVEITFTGPITVFEELCDHCGEEQHARQFSVFDDGMEKEYFFEPGDEKNMNVRVLHREGVPNADD